MPSRIPPQPPVAVAAAPRRRRWTDFLSSAGALPGGGGALALAAEPAPPGVVRYAVRPGLVIELAGRGVRWAAQLDPSGFPVLVATDSRGVRIAWQIVTPEMDVAEEIERLWVVLDARDPIGLRLHR